MQGNKKGQETDILTDAPMIVTQTTIIGKDGAYYRRIIGRKNNSIVIEAISRIKIK